MNGLGLELARTKVGDRYVVEHMRAHGYNVGGEQSAYYFVGFLDNGGYLIAALQVLVCVKELDRPVSEVCRCFEPVRKFELFDTKVARRSTRSK